MRGAIAAACLLLTTACGGGGGDSAGSGRDTTPVLAADGANVVPVTIDDGPAELGTGSDPYRQVNIPFVSVTLCVPGTDTCQTIDHVEVDTGSIGLRIVAPVLNAAMRAGLPYQAGGGGNPIGECYGYVDGYVFGSVRNADFAIGGERVAAMPVHLIGDDGRFAAIPASCASGGGTAFTTVKGFGANGILGIGVAPTDCGDRCAAGGAAAATYYDCPSTGCAGIVARASRAAAPFEQLPNPVAAFVADDNGSILELPRPADDGSTRTLAGTLTFGIGTRSNNLLGDARVLTTTASTDDDGYGLLTATFRGATLPNSFVDSGTNTYLFAAADIPQCADNQGYYCPATPIAEAATLTGRNGTAADAGFTLRNAEALFAKSGAALPGLGADPGAVDAFSPYPDSFDFGVPFFFGRRVFTAIEGRSAGGTPGPFVAF